MHDRTVPKRYMPDVLKNNYIDSSALSLVKNIDDIDEIWDRLKAAYGDTKLLLKKKIGELETNNICGRLEILIKLQIHLLR